MKGKVLLIVALALTTLLASVSYADVTELVSIDTNGSQFNDPVWLGSISATGRYVVFIASTPGLYEQVYLRDRYSNKTESVSGAGFSSGHHPSVSKDGRYVVFASWTTAPPYTSNIYLRDMMSGDIELVNVDSYGQTHDGGSDSPTISSNGRYVIFYSQAALSAEACETSQIYRRDLQMGITELVSVSTSGGCSNNYHYPQSISYDGRYVAFSSAGTNLVPNDTNNKADVFVRDMQTGVTERVSVNSMGNESNGLSMNSDMSGDGMYVVFESTATNLDGYDNNNRTDCFLHNRNNGVTEVITDLMMMVPADGCFTKDQLQRKVYCISDGGREHGTRRFKRVG